MKLRQISRIYTCTFKTQTTEKTPQVCDTCDMCHTFDLCSLFSKMEVVHTKNGTANPIAFHHLEQFGPTASQMKDPRINTLWIVYTIIVHSQSPNTTVRANFNKIQK